MRHAGLTLLSAAIMASVFSLAAAATAGLDMEVVARAAGETGAQSTLTRVDDDGTLRSGDGVQVRLRVSQDAYVYVIHFGSSRSAVLLHPFSGRDEDALVRAGELRAIPSADGFLTLDRRTGRESLYAFASPVPLGSLSSLLVKMEAAGSDREAVTQTLRAVYPEALALNFGHHKALTRAPTAATPDSGAARSSAFQGFEEQGVLSAEGSKIQEFVGGKPLRPEEPAVAAPRAETPQPQPAQPPPAKPADSGGWLGKLFSLGGAAPGTPSAAEPAEPATTFALPPADGADADPPQAAASASAQAPASESGETVSSPAATTADETRASAAPAAAPPAGANPQLDVAALDEIFASLDQPKEAVEPGQSETTATGAVGNQSVAFGARPEANQAVPSSDAPAQTPSAEAPAEGLVGTLGTLLQTAAPEPAAPAGGTAVGAAEPPETPPAPQTRPDPEATSAEPAAASSQEGGLFSRLFGSAAPSGSETTAVSSSPQPASVEEPLSEPAEAASQSPPAPQVSESQAQPEPSDEGGLFSRLFGSAAPSGSETTAVSSPPQPASVEEPLSEPAEAASQSPPAPQVSESRAQPEPSDEGGLFSRLFGGPSSSTKTGEAAVAESDAGVTDGPSSAPNPGAAAAAAPAAAGSPPGPEESEAVAQSDAPASTVVIGPARTDTGGRKTVVIGPALAPEPAAGPTESPAPQAATEGDGPAGAPEVAETASVSEAPSRGFLAGLFSSSPPAPDAASLTEPAADKETPSSETSMAPSASTQIEEPAEGGGEAGPETVEDRSGGLLGGLAGLFAGSPSTESQAPEPEVQSAPAPESREALLAKAPEPEPVETAAPAGEDPPALEETLAAGVPEGPADGSPESGSGGLLSGLAGFFSGAASTPPEAVDRQARSASTPEPEEALLAKAPEPEPVAAAAPTGEDPAVAARASAGSATAGISDPPAEVTKESDAGGLLSGLASLFSSAEQAPDHTTATDLQTQSAAPDTAVRSPVVTAPAEPEPSAADAENTAAAPEAGSGGIFGGLTRLFGGSEPSTQTSVSDTQAGGSAESESPGQTPEPAAAPAFKKVTRADGQTVVILQGPPGRPDVPAGTSEVLAAEGSKIRALLDPEPEPAATAALATPPPAPAAPAETTPRLIASESDFPAAGTSLTASAQAPALNTGVTQPGTTAAGPVSVAPDEVQAALAAGAAAATRPAAETLAALTAPAAVPELEVAPITEIDVTADDNVSASIVLVVTPTGTGSGVLLDDAGHVLANWHVVAGYPMVSVSFKAADAGFPSSERTFSARVVRLNKTADLALLRIDEPPDDLLPVRFADASQIQPGDVLHAIGHPASGAWTHTLGKISTVKPESSWYAGRNLLHRGTVLQAKLLDDPGSAGAPLFNNRLELVGISAVSRTKKGVLTGVSVETIRLFLEAPPPGG